MKTIKISSYISILAISLIFSSNIMAQDMHLSQFFESPVTLNPATTGMDGAQYRIHAHQRTQWASVASKPYLTEALSFDMPYSRFGVGAYILNNTAGAGNLNEFHFLASGSFHIMEYNKIHHLCTGLQLGFIHKSFNPDKLFFEEQYDPTIGTFNQNMSNGEDFTKTGETLFDLNFGIYYRTTARNQIFNKRTKKGGIPPLYAGLAAFHLIQPKEKFIDKNGVFNRRWLGYAGGMYKINDDIALEANLLYQRSAKNNDFQIGLLGYYRFDNGNEDYIVSLGVLYRVKDAVIAQIGFKLYGFDINFGYDINCSSLREVSHGRGGFEFSITYTRESDQITSFFKGAIF